MEAFYEQPTVTVDTLILGLRACSDNSDAHVRMLKVGLVDSSVSARTHARAQVCVRAYLFMPVCGFVLTRNMKQSN